MIGPPLNHLAEELSDRLTIVRIDIDREPRSPTKYGVRSIPTLLIQRDGEVKATKIGAEPKQKLMSWINSVLS